MSDMSSLSHEYASTSDFSRQINEAVLLLKKRFLGKRGASKVSDEDVQKAAGILQRTVETVLRRFGEPLEKDTLPRRPIPEDVLTRIEVRFRADWDYVRDDLKKVLGALQAGASLEIEDLNLLDSICEAADASASATFRKLWRR